MFAKEVYIRRRRTLLEKLKGESGIVVFLGNVDSPAQYRDNCYKWRQDSNWLYFFGIDEPGFAAILDLDSGDGTVYADDFGLDDIIWMGPQPGVKSLAESVGIDRVASGGAFDLDVLKAVMDGRKVHFLPVSRYYNASKMSSLLGLQTQDVFSAGKKGCAKASEPLVLAVIEMRLVKEDIEIEELERACDLGYEMHVAARRGIRPGRIEREIVGEMEAIALAKGWGVSFPTILTQHGEIFHCHSHDMPVTRGRLMVVDAGVEGDSHYASDFTRTYPTGGKFDGRQKDIYRIVYECNELAFSMTGPGVPYVDVHKSVCARLLDGLKSLGIVHGDVQEMVAAGIAGLFMPHGLGHNIGLDVHDMEDLGEDIVGYDAGQRRSEQLGLGSLRMARRLNPGNVVSDEPGIYFIPDLINLWRRDGLDKGFVDYGRLEDYLDFGGIRIEDDILVTPDGARRIGAKRLPASPEEVEAAMSDDKDNI